MAARQLGISRTAAKEIIRSGRLKLKGVPVLKPGMLLPQDAKISADEYEAAFISRGGDKLDAAFEYFGLSAAGQVCLDVGASTGGFTDCLLKRGALKVYAVENGRRQLAESLRADTRVVSMEERDIRSVKHEWFNEAISFATVDVSFISLKLVLEPIRAVLAKGADLVCLIKPQFEAGRGQLSRRGIVRDEKTRQRVVNEINSFANKLGLKNSGVLPFPNAPPKNKNQEYLAHYIYESQKITSQTE